MSDGFFFLNYNWYSYNITYHFKFNWKYVTLFLKDYFGNPGTLKTISEYAVIAGIIIMIMLAIMLLHSNYALFRNSV